MDFDSVLSIASQNQGSSSLTKRYSLKPGQPKKDPRVKGVSSSAVQAFLRKQETAQKKKDFEKKKQKEELLAKRVELKSDRKARAMASRTKDNFHGYNGIPIVDQPKKRQSKAANFEEQSGTDDAYDYEDNYEYEETDSESEPEPTPALRPQGRSTVSTKMSNAQKKTSAPPKAAPPPLNFADLLKLAEKKQFEPVELKPAKKTEERLRTAEEIREFELERKAKKQDKGRDVKPDKSLGHKDGKSNMMSQKKYIVDKEGMSQRSSSERSSSGISKTPKPHTQTERPHSSAKSSHGSKPSSSSSGALSGKAAMKGTSASVKQTGYRPQSGDKPTTSSDLNSKKGYPGPPQAKINSSGSRADAASNSSRPSGPGQGVKGPGHSRPSQGNMNKKGPPQKPGRGEVPRAGGNPPPRPGINGPVRSAPAGSSKQAESQQPRPRSSMQGCPVPGATKPSANGQGKPSRPLNSMGPGSGRPPCTVVSETISSKNFAPKQGTAARPPVPQGPRTVIGPTGHRILARPPGPVLPPITSSYKRMYEDEEYDSEMDDFIDDEGEDQDEISKHIRDIFGYDRTRYKDESDYALKFMESSWKEQQKEEAQSLRWGIKEDEEDMRMEEEEMKRKQVMKAKRKKT